MLFSCKISSSVLSFLESQGEEITPLLEATPLPEEFLRDPSYWMQANEMESFLSQALQISQKHFEGPLFQKIGHSGPELRSWGIFDSVLRMMPGPQEILSQPERFLAYFISPAPPIDNIQRTETGVEFDVPVSTEQYPLATAYLAASFESLPLYVGQTLANCEWKSIHIKLRWSTDQKNFFEGVELGHSLSPDLMRNVVGTLEKHSKELEEKNRELQAKNEALLLSQKKMEESLRAQGSFSAAQEVTLIKTQSLSVAPVNAKLISSSDSKDELLQNLSRLGDYMVRARQLITMLIGQGHKNPQIKEAMKRVDWERVQNQFPVTLDECRKVLQPALEESVEEKLNEQNKKKPGEHSYV